MVESEYAKAVYELALEENKVELFWDLFVAVDKTNDDPDYKKIMDSPMVSKDRKKAMIKTIYHDFDETFLNFMYVLVDHNRVNDFDAIGHEYRKLVRKDNNILFIDVLSAKELTAAQKKKLTSSLTLHFSNKKLDFKFIVKPDLIGGIQIISNGVSIDMTLKATLDRIKEDL